MNRLITSGLLLASILAIHPPALAQPPEPEQDLVAGARAHFARGETFYQLGQFEKALAEFEAAIKLVKRPSIVLNMAQCLRNLKRHDKALFFYKLYLSEYERQHPGWPPPYQDDVKKQIQRLEALIRKTSRRSSVWIQGIKLAGAQVLVDGEPRVLTPMTRPLTVTPGKHVVEVQAAGHQPWRRRAKITRGQELLLKARLVPLPGRSTFWLVSMVASAALSGGAEAMALVYTSRANEHFTGTAAYHQDKNLALGGQVAAGVFGALAVTSLVLYLMSGGDGEATATGSSAGLLPSTGGLAGSLKVTF